MLRQVAIRSCAFHRGVTRPRVSNVSRAASNVSQATETLVDCSRVTVQSNQFGAGAYANTDFKKGDVVECGIVRVLTDVDGNVNP
jgi:hypothetical protein